MRSILLTVLLAITFITVKAQVVPPIDLGKKGTDIVGIQLDKTNDDGIRLVYSEPSYWWPHIHKRSSYPAFFSTVFAQKDSIGTKYGITLYATDDKKVLFKEGGKVLMRTVDGEVYNGSVLYGCDENMESKSVVTPNLMNPFSPTSHNVTRTKVYCHLTFPYEALEHMAKNGLEKLRIETRDAYYEISLKPSQKINEFYVQNLKEVRNRLETVESSSFDEGF